MRNRIGLSEYRDCGWEWSVQRPGEQEEWYRTNGYGEGLWIYVAHVGYRQIRGTCQFRLPADRKRAYRKLYYLFVEKGER